LIRERAFPEKDRSERRYEATQHSDVPNAGDISSRGNSLLASDPGDATSNLLSKIRILSAQFEGRLFKHRVLGLRGARTSILRSTMKQQSYDHDESIQQANWRASRAT
jgi:hypothetical protein